MAAGLQNCSWHFHLYYCWLGTQLPVWPLPLPVTPERRGSCWDCSSCSRENALQGLFSQTFLLPAILIPRVIPAMGRRDLPSPPKDIHALSGGLLGARAELMERGSRAAPLIRVVLPDSFSKHFPRKLDALAAIWTTRKRNFTAFGGRQLHKMEGVGHFLSWQQTPFK